MQEQSCGRFGNRKIVVKIHTKRMQVRHLGVVIVLLQAFQALRIKDPGGSSCQRSVKELGKQIVLKVKNTFTFLLAKSVLQGR